MSCPECETPSLGGIVRVDKDQNCIKCGKNFVTGEPSQGLRHNTSKPRLDLNSLGLAVQHGEALVWEYGLEKYSLGNWLKGMSWQGSAASMQRHFTAFINGENLDPETGLPHVDHIICCAKILSNSYHTRPDLDDRAPTDKRKTVEIGQKNI